VTEQIGAGSHAAGIGLLDSHGLEDAIEHLAALLVQAVGAP
jgi:hypothetical protein